jgi:Ni/Co efflux regulator RcnB
MKQISNLLALAVLATSFSGAVAVAQDHHDNHKYVKHDEWHKGAKIKKADWGRGEHIDYAHYHLQAPPHGYEWREVDGNFILAATATGVIATVIAESAAH